MRKVLLPFFVIFFIPFARLSAQSGTITIHFVFQFQGKPLEAGKLYKTAGGEEIRIDQVRFYLAAPREVTSDGRPPEINLSDHFWLIDSKDTASWNVSFPVQAPDTLSAIAFWIGVDSLNQVRGARTGGLDPLKGMYWTWNSGYVAVKIEGHSPLVSAAGGQLEYHLGGYRYPNEVRTLLTLESLSPFPVATHGNVDVTIPFAIDRFFAKPFSIKNQPGIMTPGPVAKQLMQQFKKCFLTLIVGKKEK